MTDFRALCVELTDCLEKADWPHRYKTVFQQWVDISRAALAEPDGPAVPEGREPASVATQPNEPEAEGPSDEALANFTAWFCRNYPGPDTLIHRPEWHAPKVFRAAADAIARWGRAAAAPVPVSERLPGDALCWWYEPDEDDDGSGYGGSWTLLRIRGGVSCYTHWLPANALPLPAPEGGKSQP